jgi:hypothetical protein
MESLDSLHDWAAVTLSGRSGGQNVLNVNRRNRSTGKWAPWLGWSMWIVGLVGLAAAAMLATRNPPISTTQPADGLVAGIVWLSSWVGFGLVGALVVSSLPSNRIGWILCGITFSVGSIAFCRIRPLRAGHGTRHRSLRSTRRMVDRLGSSDTGDAGSTSRSALSNRVSDNQAGSSSDEGIFALCCG